MTRAALVALASLAAWPGCGTRPQGASATPPLAPFVAQPDPADLAAGELFATLDRRDYPGAQGLLEPGVKKALPLHQLSSIWETQIAQFGELLDWTVVQRAVVSDTQIRFVMLRFERGRLKAIVSVTTRTREIAGLLFREVLEPSPRAPYVDSMRFRDVAVSVGEEPFVLDGTLSLPIGSRRVPAAVLVHGSGPHDRDETIGANRPFKDLAEGLASRGIAVLRYEKRTLVHGHRLTPEVTLDEEVVLDAVAAVKLLRSRREIDPNRVYVIGHSLGALVTPEIGVRAAPVAGTALLAPPGRPPWDAILDQLRYLEAPPEVVAEAEAAAQRLRAGTPGSGNLLGVPGSYWLDCASRDGVGMAKKLARPLLILHGDRDYQVVGEDIAAWEAGLRGEPWFQVARIPGANHLFIPGTGKPGRAEYDHPGHVDPAVIETLASFLSASRQP